MRLTGGALTEVRLTGGAGARGGAMGGEGTRLRMALWEAKKRASQVHLLFSKSQHARDEDCRHTRLLSKTTGGP